MKAWLYRSAFGPSENAGPRATTIPKSGYRSFDEIMAYLIVLAAFVRRKVIPPCCRML